MLCEEDRLLRLQLTSLVPILHLGEVKRLSQVCLIPCQIFDTFLQGSDSGLVTASLLLVTCLTLIILSLELLVLLEQLFEVVLDLLSLRFPSRLLLFEDRGKLLLVDLGLLSCRSLQLKFVIGTFKLVFKSLALVRDLFQLDFKRCSLG